MRAAPERIYLQHDGLEEHFTDAATWCQDRINDEDVEYVRADLFEVIPRRPYYDDQPDGYVESDRDFVMNNLEACIAFLELLTQET